MERTGSVHRRGTLSKEREKKKDDSQVGIGGGRKVVD